MRLLEAASPSLLEAAELSSVLNAMRTHEVRVVSELSVADLRELLALDPPRRPVLSIDLATARTVDQGVSLALDAMAGAAATFWPALWGEDWSNARDDALGRAHRPVRLDAASKRLPDLVPAWADAAIGRLLRGRPPRVPRASTEIEWAQLALAISPLGVTLVAPLEEGPELAQRIAALEWLARHGGVCVLVLTRDRPSHAGFDRILHGYRRFRRAAEPAGPSEREAAERDSADPIVIALPSAPEGFPHPMSPIEQKLFRLIQADDELRPLFAFNRTVPDIPLRNVRVDIVWLEGRVAIEIDGCEHRSVAKFRADRHRDYELMCAGYRVLRMTNEDVETDAPFAVEKIRRVARLARGDVG
jgi:very-short-patch-repair endonuclease